MVASCAAITPTLSGASTSMKERDTSTAAVCCPTIPLPLHATRQPCSWTCDFSMDATPVALPSISHASTRMVAKSRTSRPNRPLVVIVQQLSTPHGRVEPQARTVLDSYAASLVRLDCACSEQRSRAVLQCHTGQRPMHAPLNPAAHSRQLCAVAHADAASHIAVFERPDRIMLQGKHTRRPQAVAAAAVSSVGGVSATIVVDGRHWSRRRRGRAHDQQQPTDGAKAAHSDQVRAQYGPRILAWRVARAHEPHRALEHEWLAALVEATSADADCIAVACGGERRAHCRVFEAVAAADGDRAARPVQVPS
eukprot:6235210-Prymnesium_polylepis.2